MTDSSHPTDQRSPIRSFVRREGRFTDGQRRALTLGMSRWGIDESETTLDLTALFGRDAKTVCEIGCGNGDTLATLAQREPQTNFIGIEVYRPGVGNLMRQLMAEDVNNVRVSTTDAVQLLTQRLTPQVLDECLVFFPDPWPKKRHHKRRLIQHPFLDVVARVLKPNGRLHIATDWAPYAEHIVETLSDRRDFHNTTREGDYIERPPSRPLTKFEQRGLKLGHEVFDVVFQRET